MPRLRKVAAVVLLGVAGTGVLTLAAAGAAPARVTVVLDRGSDGTARLIAKVFDSTGAPLAGSTVTFRAKTAFGWLTLGEATTDRAGTAAHAIPPSSFSEVSVETGDATPVTAAILIRRDAPPQPDRRPGRDVLRDLSPQPGFLSPYPVPQMAILALILGGIWTVYGYIVTMLVRIRREGRPAAWFRPR